MTRQCLKRRISNIDRLPAELTAWESERNKIKGTVDWQFTCFVFRQFYYFFCSCSIIVSSFKNFVVFITYLGSLNLIKLLKNHLNLLKTPYILKETSHFDIFCMPNSATTASTIL